jgi:hypothetical protein
MHYADELDQRALALMMSTIPVQSVCDLPFSSWRPAKRHAGVATGRFATVRSIGMMVLEAR